MSWRKLGLVFSPEARKPWMLTHAALPVAMPRGDRLRVYFASRDDRQRSHVGWVELDAEAPTKVLAVSEDPVLAPGPLGHFDDHGVYAASIVRDGSKVLMYYIGWNPGPRHPLFYSSIGLAISTDGGDTFQRHSPAPIMARSAHDPCLVTSPFVLKEEGRWRMWYVSGYAWTEDAGQLRSRYHIKYAESRDGIDWHRAGVVAIDNGPNEPNIARPCVLRAGAGYEMWYSFDRGAGYRIGRAVSEDGVSWKREDGTAGIAPSEAGWDSEAQTYPWVTRLAGREYMLYNGNRFGRDGFGCAVR